MITRREMMKTLALGSTILAADFVHGCGTTQPGSQPSPTPILTPSPTPTATPTCLPQTSDSATLDRFFQTACQQFNNHDPTIKNLFTPNIHAYSVNTKQKFSGASNVIAFFVRDWTTESSSFTPINYNVTTVMLPNGSPKGIIIGTACWRDIHGPETIGFVFQWVQSTTGAWLLERVYGD